ncbi:MAG: ribonuclease HI [Candidatus Didemnitutus sp.]|nr:ribonuclease HI [Candidatus Didemnitutus sp.]
MSPTTSPPLAEKERPPVESEGEGCSGEQRDQTSSNRRRQASEPDFIVVCDGGAKPNPGIIAWAAIVQDALGYRRMLSGVVERGTNNQAELLAALHALESLPDGATVRVRTDSRYLRDGASTWISLWLLRNWRTVSGAPVVNRELWERLILATQRLSVEWQWVKGHAGDELNEMVDAECARLLREAFASGRLVA